MKRAFLASNRLFTRLVILGGAACGLLVSPASADTNCVAPPAGLVGWWRAEGNAADESGANGGTLVEQTAYGAGRVGQGFAFDGSGDLVHLGNVTNLSLQDFTIETWIRRASPTVVTYFFDGSAQFFCCGLGGYNFGIDPGGKLFVGKVGVSVVQPTAVITDVNWHHVAVTKSGSAVVFYIDGVAHSAPAFGVVFDFPTTAAIGARPYDKGNSFLGTIDELSVYGRALTAGEIQAIYGAGSSGKCTAAVPPSIFAQPTNQTVVAGDTASFSVVANGTLPLSYQWSFNGTNISAATQSELVLLGVQAAQAGEYSVQVTNAFGSVTSSNAVLAVTPAPSCAAPPTGLVGWWRAAGSGLDETGGNNGTLAGNTSYAAGRVGQSFLFDGDGDAVSLGTASNLRLQDFTIEAWIQRSSASAVTYFWDGGAQLFGGGADGFNFGIDADSRLFMGKVGISLVKSSATVSDTDWHHVAVTKSGSTVFFYVDGVAYAASPYSQVFTYSWGFAIGARADTQGNGFLGKIDDLAVYSRALNPSEIQVVYSAAGSGKCTTPVPPSIFAQPTNQVVVAGDTASFAVVANGTVPLSYQWFLNGTNLDGATQSTLVLPNVRPTQAGDYSVQVTNAFGAITSSNAVLTVDPAPACAAPPAGLISWWRGEGDALDFLGGNHGVELTNRTFTAGRVGLAFDMTSANQYVEVPHSSSLNPTGSFTIEAWIFPTQDQEGAIVCRWGDTGDYANNRSFQLALHTGQAVGFHISDAANQWVPAFHAFSTTNVITLNAWNHVAAVYDQPTGTRRLYVNSVKVAERTHTPVAVYPGIAKLGIGVVFTSSTTTASTFKGLIDEPAIVGRALTDNDIQAIYAAGGSGTCVIPVAPSISTQPADRTVLVGDTAVFTVLAAGTPPMNYQWQFNGTNLDGATSSTFTRSNAQLAQAGTYSVQVSNTLGSVVSSNAVLAVIDLGPNFFDDFEPGIHALQWSGFSATVLAANYGGAVSGTNSLWFGGTSPRYAITRSLNTTAGGVVEFYLRLAKGTSPTWDSPELPGDGVVVDYSKNGGSSWTQLARYDTPAYTNWTFCAVTIPPAAQAPSTLFRWRQPVSSPNLDHWALDDVAVFMGPRPPQITNQPASQTAFVGQAVTLSVGARGTAPLSYQWQFNETTLAGATGSTLTLTNIQFNSAGSYSVVVTNEAGATTSSNALLTVSFPPAAVQIMNGSAAANTDVSLPIVMVANGNENALGFSLNFDPAHLAFAGVTLGAGAPGGSLLFNTSQITDGKLGVAIALPTGATFAAGTQEIAQVSFTARVLTNATVSVVAFGDQPIGRQLSDAPGNVLPATYASGSVSIPAVDYEGDVSPRPDGNKAVTITDWVLVGRYAARLDYPTNASEFQRADSAPRATLGDGAIKITDWVQAGRYAAGLDLLTPVGGPTSEIGGAPRVPKDPGDCRVRAADAVFVQGHAGTLSVLLEAQGNEAAVGFSLSFDPTCLSYVSTALGSGASGATLNVNASQAAAGKLGLGLMLPTGTSFAVGTQEIVKVTFSAAAATGNSAVAFGDLPVPRDVSDASAGALTASYVSSTVTVNPPPTLSITMQSQDVVLSWPLWATNFALQAAIEALPSSEGWTNVDATVNAAANGERTVVLPRTGNATFYRLYRP